MTSFGWMALGLGLSATALPAVAERSQRFVHQPRSAQNAAEAPTAAPPVLIQGRTIAIDDVHGRFGSLTLDVATNCLVASHLNDDLLEIFDLASNRLVARVEVGPVVATAVDAQTGRYFASIVDDQTIVIVERRTCKVTGSVRLPGDPGAVLFEPSQRRLYVAAHEGSVLWVVDPDRRSVVRSISVPADPEDLVCDPAGRRIYVTGSASSEVAVIDAATNRLLGRWPTAPALHPHGLALAPNQSCLLVAGDNGELVALDLPSGRAIAAAPIGEHVRQMAYDSELRRLYCAGPDWLFPVACDRRQLLPLEKLSTATGATNVIVDPRSHAVWLTFTDGEDSFARSWSWSRAVVR